MDALKNLSDLVVRSGDRKYPVSDVHGEHAFLDDIEIDPVRVKAVQQFSDALLLMPALTRLALEDVKIREKGAKALAGSLEAWRI